MQHQANQVMEKSFCIVLLLVLVSIAPACRETDERNGRKSLGEKITTSTVAVVPIGKKGLKTLVEERHGKTLLLNIWATWCAPCVAEFPDLVKLSQSYDTSKVEVVAISADYPDEIDSKILPFLRKMNVPFRVYVAQFEHQEDFINAVNPAWSGALPATLTYDVHAKQQTFHVGQLTFDDFKREVDTIKGEL
jgi:thiol-disulfide isomerase/thioredoxin